MTEKENYLRLISGKQPEWVPQYTFGPNPIGKPEAVRGIGPSVLNYFLRTEGADRDVWGVLHVPVPDAGNAKIPEPGSFILKDIRQWRDVIKAPDFSDIDWEALAKKNIEDSGVNRETTATSFGLHVGYFQNLMNFMGFSEGLCAMYEEPEEVKALMEYLCDFYCSVGEKCIDYYKPDIYSITDDTAAWKNSFISVEMYRELIKPFAMRQAKIGLDRGLPVEMHNCGRCEEFIDDWRDFGVVAWNPAQTSNDLLAVKKKYGNELVICGGWDIAGELSSPDVSEETIKQSVRDAIDKYAPGGGYAFAGGFLGAIDDARTKQKNRWIAEEVDSYGAVFYKK